MTDWLDMSEMVGPESWPWRRHMDAAGIEVPADATEHEGWQAATNLRELILRHWADTGQQEYMLISGDYRAEVAVTATLTLPDLHANGQGPTRVIPRRTWPLVEPLPPDTAAGQMTLL